jgi:Rrf2 family iron-sulfur cluster assembly transcriptional regulator
MRCISNAGLLVITTVVEIAIHGGRMPVSADEVHRRLRLSHRTLEPYLQALVHGGILTSVRGARGGYGLARKPNNISVEDILRASGILDRRNDELDDSVSFLARAIVVPALSLAAEEFARQLREITVWDFLLATIPGREAGR